MSGVTWILRELTAYGEFCIISCHFTRALTFLLQAWRRAA
jgi:hypothetical protein